MTRTIKSTFLKLVIIAFFFCANCGSGNSTMNGADTSTNDDTSSETQQILMTGLAGYYSYLAIRDDDTDCSGGISGYCTTGDHSQRGMLLLDDNAHFVRCFYDFSSSGFVSAGYSDYSQNEIYNCAYGTYAASSLSTGEINLQFDYLRQTGSSITGYNSVNEFASITIGETEATSGTIPIFTDPYVEFLSATSAYTQSEIDVSYNINKYLGEISKLGISIETAPLKINETIWTGSVENLVNYYEAYNDCSAGDLHSLLALKNDGTFYECSIIDSYYLYGLAGTWEIADDNNISISTDGGITTTIIDYSPENEGVRITNLGMPDLMTTNVNNCQLGADYKPTDPRLAEYVVDDFAECTTALGLLESDL